MGEDMTYTTTEPTRAQLTARVRELEAQNAELLAAAVQNAQDMLALRLEADGLRARLEAVPVEAILALYDGTPRGGWIVPHLDAVGDWLVDVCPSEMGPEMEPR